MAKIPYKLVNGILLIPVAANGKEGFFALDTGAMQTAVNRAHFPEMQGEQIDIAKFTEGVRKSTAAEGVLDSLCFAGTELSNLPVLIMDLMYVENPLKTLLPGLTFLGTLGIDVIRDHTVLLDYKSDVILLDPEEDFENAVEVPMECDKLPVIPVEVCGKTCDFVLDTGASFCLLGERFQEEGQLIPVSETPKIVTVPMVRVGGISYENIKAAISDITAIRKRVAVEGVIGYQVLSKQRDILNFEKGKLLLEKTEK